ncbi:DNA-directed RNA polymerase subunit M/transcription elongation factor TFIIS [Streptomyces phaeoluteigriseus]
MSSDEPLPERPEMDFTLVRNGMDYLSSAVLYLTGKIQVPMDAGSLWPEAAQHPTFSQPTPPWLSDRHLKYGVLHLQAATEVLLKARLVREHWSLVFKDPGNATRAKYESGDFDSCGTTAALDRLTKIVGVPITDKERKAIGDLANTRNALTHYGHKANAYAVESRAAGVLSFLIDFVPRHLQRSLSSEAAEVATTMEAVRRRLRDIEVLVKKREQDLASDLDEVAERVVHCPSCRRIALVAGETPVACRFCARTFESPTDAAVAYWQEVLDEDETAGLQKCPACGHDAVMLANTRAEPQEEVALCFNCGNVYTRK